MQLSADNFNYRPTLITIGRQLLIELSFELCNCRPIVFNYWTTLRTIGQQLQLSAGSYKCQRLVFEIELLPNQLRYLLINQFVSLIELKM